MSSYPMTFVGRLPGIRVPVKITVDVDYDMLAHEFFATFPLEFPLDEYLTKKAWRSKYSSVTLASFSDASHIAINECIRHHYHNYIAQKETRKVTIKNDYVSFGGNKLSFQRTLRVPEKHEGGLPPGLGKFVIATLDDGTYGIPMYNAEAMWMSFEEVIGAFKISVGSINVVTGEIDDKGLKFGEYQNYVKQRWIDGYKVGPGLVRQFVASSKTEESVETQIRGYSQKGGIQIEYYPQYTPLPNVYKIGRNYERLVDVDFKTLGDLSLQTIYYFDCNELRLPTMRDYLCGRDIITFDYVLHDMLNTEVKEGDPCIVFYSKYIGEIVAPIIDGCNRLHVRDFISRKCPHISKHPTYIFDDDHFDKPCRIKVTVREIIDGVMYEDGKVVDQDDDYGYISGNTRCGGEFGLEMAAGGTMRQEIIKDLSSPLLYLETPLTLELKILSISEYEKLTGKRATPPLIDTKTYLKHKLPWYEYYLEKEEVKTSFFLSMVKSTTSHTQAPVCKICKKYRSNIKIHGTEDEFCSNCIMMSPNVEITGTLIAVDHDSLEQNYSSVILS